MTDHCFVCDRPLSEGSEGNVCQVCLDLTAQYQEKRETRISRLENRAAATRDKASAHAAAARQMAGAIPFGQPILVGHHSETRDRRYRDRIWQKFGQSHAAFEKAKRQEARTDAARRNETFDNGDPSPRFRSDASDIDLQSVVRIVCCDCNICARVVFRVCANRLNRSNQRRCAADIFD